jgi:DNA-binding transcriptional MocR family regulator
MHIAALARKKIDCEAISHALARRGILIHSLDRYFVGPTAQTGFVIAYAAADKQQLKVAVDALAEEVRECWK